MRIHNFYEDANGKLHFRATQPTARCELQLPEKASRPQLMQLLL